MIPTSNAFHSKILERNPDERILFAFGDFLDTGSIPTVTSTVMLWTGADVNTRSPVRVVESVNPDTELSIGQVTSATLSCEIFNEHGYLTEYLTEEDYYTNDCGVYLGVKTASSPLVNPSWYADANCVAFIRDPNAPDSPGVAITGHDMAPYLRIGGSPIPLSTPLPSSLEWPVKAIVVDSNASESGPRILVIGQFRGQYYTIDWEFGDTWGDIANGYSSWGDWQNTHATWGDALGEGRYTTFSTSYWNYEYKYPQIAAIGHGYSIVGQTMYEFGIDGRTGVMMEDKWEYAPLGVFRMDAPDVLNEYSTQFSAYDRMTLFDVDVTEFLDDHAYPTTLADLLWDLCDECGVLYSTSPFTNSTMPVAERPELAGTPTGRTLLRYIAEAAGANARMTRYGSLELVEPSTTPVYVINNNPAYPTPHAIYEMYIGSYTVAQIDKVSIENPQEEGDPVTVAVGSGTNDYRLSSNPLLQGGSTADVTTRITPIYNILSALLSYRPTTLRCVCDWSVQAGDCVYFWYLPAGATQYSAIIIPVFTQTITFNGIAVVTYESKGSAVRPVESDSYYGSSSALQLQAAAIRANIKGSNTRAAATYLPKTGNAYRSAAIPFGQVDSTSTSTAFTAQIDGITELRDGVCAFIRNGVVTSASGCTLDVNGLGAKPICNTMTEDTRVTTAFNVAYTMLFVYNSTRVEDGCWDMYYGYNSDTNTIAYNVRRQQSDGTMYAKLYRYEVVFTRRDGSLLPVNGVSNKPAVLTKALTTEAWDPYRPIYYYSTTTAVDIGDSPSASYMYIQHGSADMRYGFNVDTTLVEKKDAYLQLIPQADGTVKLAGDNCLVQALPTTADGYVYLYLGRAYSTTQITLDINHPMYAMIGGVCKPWRGETPDAPAQSSL